MTSDILAPAVAMMAPPKVTTFRISPEKLEKWMHQNKAEYTGVLIEGCLMDNFVLACKRGFAAVYEHYLNCWSSDYLVEFEPFPSQGVWRNWYRFEDTQREEAQSRE